jgi:hypothetical protein
MKSISVQYQELKEGRMTQHQFLRNARMLFPNFVTNHNSFDDSVKILKSKGLLNEGNAVKGTPDKAPSYDYPTQPAKYKKVVQEPEVDEQDGIYPATTVTDIPKEEVSKPIKSKNRPDGLEPAKDKDKKNEMKKIRIVKESKRSLTELTSVSDKEIQSSEFNSLKNIQKDYLSNHPLSIQPTSFSGNKESPLKLTDIRWYNNQDGTFGFDMAFERPGNRDEYIAITFYKDNKNNPVKKISVTDRIQGSWKEYKDDIVGYLNKAMRSAQVDSRYVDSVITALSRMTPEKIRDNNVFNENSVTAKQIQDKYNEMFGRNPQTTFADVAKALGVSESEIAIALFSPDLSKNLREDDGDDAAFDAMIKKAMEEEEAEEAIKSGFGIYDPSDERDKKKISKDELDKLWKAWEKRGEKPFAGVLPVGSQIDIERNKLRETIKKMVNKVLNEYEKGDESDEAPSNREAVSEIVEMMIDKLEDIKSFKKSELEDVFSDYEDTVGKRYSDGVFNDVIDQLKRKGYNLK